MIALRAAWAWLKEHAVVVLLAVGSIIGFLAGGFLFSQVRRPDRVVKDELKRIDAGNKAARDAILNGADAAVETLERQHADAIQTLDDAQRSKMDRLRRDPRALAKYLDSLSRKR